MWYGVRTEGLQKEKGMEKEEGSNIKEKDRRNRAKGDDKKGA